MNLQLATLMGTIGELRAHLGAAKIARSPSDEPIISNHIDTAYDLALRAERMIETQLATAA